MSISTCARSDVLLSDRVDLPNAVLANREAMVVVLLPVEKLKLDVGTRSSSFFGEKALAFKRLVDGLGKTSELGA